ncbi:MAG TPA: patatin-like phospholipase family protein [Burkholderiales bacterium]|nr:patatin-like phospholipase family protein [Burkholderiales bacterium]
MAALVLATLLAMPAPAVYAADDSAATPRPRIGLVLGGGGARGAAHIGVLKVLDELRIPVDYVVGTSVGSIVGGFYASGMSVPEIEREVLAMDWADMFQDYPSRADRSFRRKRDDDTYAIKAKPGFNNGKIEIPLAYIRGQKLDLTLNRLTLPVVDIRDFDRLPVPYRAVAADLETGKEVVLAAGSLPKAMRASMAVPAAFDPVEIDGRLLVDGGIANNVPVSVVRAMGAEVLIVVDVGSGLFAREDITSALSITGQLANYMFTLNSQEQLKTLSPRDVLIRPKLGDIGGGSFDRAGEAIPAGEEAARAAFEALRQYSLDPEQYARHLAARGQRRPSAPVIDVVRIDNQSRVSDDVIAARISARPGQPLDVKQLEKDIGTVYGLEIFESVRYDVVREEEKTILVVSAKEKRWGPGYLQFGLASSNDLEGNATIRLGMLYTLTEINKLNGEWRSGLQLGDEPSVFTEIHQPLDALSRYFVSGKISYGNRNVNVFDDEGNMLSRYGLRTSELELGLGRELGTWGEIRLGYRRESGTAEVNIGPPAPEVDVDRGEFFLRLSDDKLDNLYFPRAGHFGKLEYRNAREQYGSRSDYDQWQAGYTQALSWGANTVIGMLSGEFTTDGEAQVEGLFRLGGLFRLSGLTDQQLSGQHAGLMELVYMHRLANIQFFKSYAGASLELGNVWQKKDDISFDNCITAGSLFLGFDTPIGPLYVGYGRTQHDDQSVYVYLGPRFSF